MANHNSLIEKFWFINFVHLSLLLTELGAFKKLKRITIEAFNLARILYDKHSSCTIVQDKGFSYTVLQDKHMS